jgi:TFIIF-interacting CTD phosphatase-like protein
MQIKYNYANYMISTKKVRRDAKKKKLALAPALAHEHKTKIKNIILDIDETLIHTRMDACEADHIFTIEKTKYYVLYRPYLHEFINFIFTNFETINLWTAATYDYAKNIVSRLLLNMLTDKSQLSKLKFFNTRQQVSKDGAKKLAKLFSTDYAKSLNIIENNTIMIDDKPSVFNYNTGNGFIIPAWTGQKDDTFLLKLQHVITVIQKENLIIDVNEKSINLAEL